MTKWKIERRPSLGHDPLTGKTIRRWIRANSEAEYSKKLKLAMADAFESHAVENISFKQYSEKWLETYKSKTAYNTQRTYEYDLHAFKSIEDMKMAAITTSDLQMIFNNNWDYTRKCEKMFLAVNQVFKLAVEEGVVRKNPCAKLSLPIRVKAEKRALTETEVKAYREAELSAEDRLFIDCEYYFGLRPEECRALTKKDFNFDKGLLHICKATVFVNGKGTLKETKNYRNRQIPIPQEFSRRHREEILSLPCDLLFARDGKPLNSYQYVQMYNRIFEQINTKLGGSKEVDCLNDMVMYTFRHNFCTHLYYSSVEENKITTKMAAYLAGNSVQVFLNTYAHLDRKREEESVISVLNDL